jgi:hypothetical protein
MTKPLYPDYWRVLSELIEHSSRAQWWDILNALSVPAVALLAAVIAIWQWKINRNRLKYELFDRRYKTYVKVVGYIKSLMIEREQIKPEVVKEFLDVIQESYFLFKRPNWFYRLLIYSKILHKKHDLYCYLKGLYDIGNRLSITIDERNSIMKDPQEYENKKDELSKRISGLFDEFKKYVKNVDNLFPIS